MKEKIIEALKQKGANPKLLDNKKVISDLESFIGRDYYNKGIEEDKINPYFVFDVSQNGNITYKTQYSDSSRSSLIEHSTTYSIDSENNLSIYERTDHAMEKAAPDYGKYKISYNEVTKTIDNKGIEIKREYRTNTLDQEGYTQQVFDGQMRSAWGGVYGSKAVLERNPDIGSVRVTITPWEGRSSDITVFNSTLYGEHIETLGLPWKEDSLIWAAMGFYGKNKELSAKYSSLLDFRKDNECIDKTSYELNDKYYDWVLAEIALVPNQTTRVELTQRYLMFMKKQIQNTMDPVLRDKLYAIITKFQEPLQSDSLDNSSNIYEEAGRSR